MYFAHMFVYTCVCVSGVALAPSSPVDPSTAPLYVVEMLTNRVLRFVQKPKGVYHGSVFYQFSGGVGPSGIAVDVAGNVYVSRFEVQGMRTWGDRLNFQMDVGWCFCDEFTSASLDVIAIVADVDGDDDDDDDEDDDDEDDDDDDDDCVCVDG
jgi:hypothetical protein